VKPTCLDILDFKQIQKYGTRIAISSLGKIYFITWKEA